jgi:hypothetical protein
VPGGTLLHSLWLSTAPLQYHPFSYIPSVLPGRTGLSLFLEQDPEDLEEALCRRKFAGLGKGVCSEEEIQDSRSVVYFLCLSVV